MSSPVWDTELAERLSRSLLEPQPDAIEKAFPRALKERAIPRALYGAGELIVGIDSEKKALIQLLIARSVSESWRERDLVRALKDIIGVTPKQASGLLSYKAKLLSDGIAPEKVDRMVQVQANRYIRRRAQMIAQYERKLVFNQAKLDLWYEEQKNGHISPKARWKSKAKAGCCPQCRREDGRNHDFMEKPPPYHPLCRCEAVLIEPEQAWETPIVTDDIEKYDDRPFSRSRTSNWVAQEGGLPPYIRAVARAMMRKGHPKDRAIGLAIGIVRNWAEGKGGVDADTKAKAVAAIASWEAKRVRAKSDNPKKGRVRKFLDLFAKQEDDVTDQIEKKTKDRVRNVASAEGSRYYRLPIGAPITAAARLAAKQRHGGKSLEEFKAGGAPKTQKLGVGAKRIHDWANAVHAANTPDEQAKVRNALRQDRIKGKLKDADYKALVAALEEKNGGTAPKEKTPAKPASIAEQRAKRAGHPSAGKRKVEEKKPAAKPEPKSEFKSELPTDWTWNSFPDNKKNASPEEKIATKLPTPKPDTPVAPAGQQAKSARSIEAQINRAKNADELADIIDLLIPAIMNGKITPRRANLLKQKIAERHEAIKLARNAPAPAPKAKKPVTPRGQAAMNRQVARDKEKADAAALGIKLPTNVPPKGVLNVRTATSERDRIAQRNKGTITQYNEAVKRVKDAKNIAELDAAVRTNAGGRMNRVAANDPKVGNFIRNRDLKRRYNAEVRAKQKELEAAAAAPKPAGKDQGAPIPKAWSDRISAARDQSDIDKLMSELEAIPEDQIGNDEFNAIADRLNAANRRNQLVDKVKLANDAKALDKVQAELEREVDENDNLRTDAELNADEAKVVRSALKHRREELKNVEVVRAPRHANLEDNAPDVLQKQVDHFAKADGTIGNAPREGLMNHLRSDKDRFEFKRLTADKGVSDTYKLTDKKTGEVWYAKATEFDNDLNAEVMAGQIARKAGFGKGDVVYGQSEAIDSKYGSFVLTRDAGQVGPGGVEGVKISDKPNYSKDQFFADVFKNQGGKDSLFNLVMFDFVIGNLVDRHSHNMFNVDDGKGGREIGFVDQGLAFRDNTRNIREFLREYRGNARGHGWDANARMFEAADKDREKLKAQIRRAAGKLREMKLDGIGDGLSARRKEEMIGFMNLRLGQLGEADFVDDMIDAMGR